MRRPLVVVVVVAVLAAGVSATSSARDSIYSDDQTVVGPVVLHEAGVTDGRLVFRISSGGCTDAASFAVDADRVESLVQDVPHLLLTIRRVRADWCKAFLPEGVEVTLDLGRDVGLTGRFTIAVTNPILPRQRRPDDGVAELRESLLQATLEAIRIEADATSARLHAAERDGASDETLERLRGRTESIEAERERIVGVDPHDYPLPEGGAHEPGALPCVPGTF